MSITYTLNYNGIVEEVWLIVILVILTTYRVTRFITRDGFPPMALPREAFVQRWGTYADAETPEQKKTSISGKSTNIFMKSLAYLWECDWCVSVYVATATVLATWYWTPLGDHLTPFTAVLLGAAASGMTGLIAQREPD